MKLSRCECKYGAPMGRPQRDLEGDIGPVKLHLYHLRLDSGGYDAGGAYWGLRSTRLYRYYWLGNVTRSNTPIIEGFLDAVSRDDAKNQIRTQYPEATFYK